MSEAKRIIKNTGYAAVSRLWLISVNLLLTPLILSYLGSEQFAIWVLFGVFLAYYMLMDLGLEVSLIREVAIAHSSQNIAQINVAFNSVLLFYLIFAAMAFGILWLFTPWLLSLLNLSPPKLLIVLDVVRWAVPIFAMISVTHVLAAIHRGIQRYDTVAKSMLLASIPNVLGTYFVLEWGYGLVGLLPLMLFVYSLQVVILVYYAKQIFPQLKLDIFMFSWFCIRQMMPVGVRVQVSKLADLASFQTDKILLAFLLPIQFVTMYDLGAKIATLIRSLPAALTSAAFPAASSLHGQKDYERMWLLYDRGSKYLLVVTLPMLMGLWITAHLVIGLWLGHVSSLVLQAVLLLTFAYWIVISLSMVFNVGTSMGWVKPIMQSALFQALFNVGLSYVLIMRFGFVGALYGTCIAIFVANVVLYIRFCMHFGQPIKKELYRLWHVVSMNILPVFICKLYVTWIDSFLQEGDRLQSFLFLIGAIAIYGLSYIFSLRWFDFFDATDERLLAGQIPVIRWFRKVKIANGEVLK